MKKKVKREENRAFPRNSILTIVPNIENGRRVGSEAKDNRRLRAGASIVLPVTLLAELFQTHHSIRITLSQFSIH